MPREDVNIKVTADEAEALRMWRRMQEGPEAVAAEMENMSRRGKRASSSLASDFDKLVGKWFSVRAGIQAAQDVFNAFIESQRELRDQALDTTIALDEQTRKLMVQAGVTGGNQFNRIRQSVLATAEARGATSSAAFEATRQLVSSGFTLDEALDGGATDEFLQLLAATNAAGGDADPQALAKALAAVLTANQQQLSAENVRGVAVPIQELFRSTNLQVANLARFAPESAVIQSASGASINEQLAIFSQLLDVTDEARASTAFRSAISRLSIAGTNRASTRGLQDIGLSPEDVDFVGEGFQEVLDRVTEALANAAPEVANAAAARIFGQEGLPFANTVLTPEAREAGRRRSAAGQSELGFAEAVETIETGRAAERRRATTRREAAEFDNALSDRVALREEMLAVLSENGRSVFEQFLADYSFRFASALTDSPGALAEVAKLAVSSNPFTGVSRSKGAANAELFEQIDQAFGLNVTVRLTNNDGIEIPSEVEAVGLNQQ